MADDVTTTAGEGGHTDRHTSGPTSQEGRTSDANGFSLPTRRSYFTTLSTVAFVSGLGIAALVTIRRGRRMHLEDLRAAETAGQHARPSTMRSSPTVTPNVRDESPLGQASSSGVIALFKEMNRAAFSRKKGHPSQEDVSPSQAPSILQRHAVKAKAPPQSVFESSVSTPPPSVLMRASKHEQSSVRSSVELTQEAVRSTSIADQLRDAREAMNEDSPVLLAIKAIGLATAIVGAATWVVVEVACLVMQVKSMDELVEKLTTIVPASERGSQALSQIGQSARQKLGGSFGRYEDQDRATAMHDRQLRAQHSGSDAPLPVDEALSQMDAAVDRGDAAAWMEILSKQLNAERRQDLEDRQKRLRQAS